MAGVLVFGLGFANAALLYGLAAAAIPLVIHLLNRRKYRETTWAAMRFLLAAIRKNQRRIRIEHWLLLLVRTLVLLCLALAMAKPFLESYGAVLLGRRTHRVFVIDASLSMNYTAAERSRFDQAKALAARLLSESRRGDAASIILSGAPPRVVIGDPSSNLAEVRKEIDELEPTHGRVDLRAVLEAVERVLEASTIPQKEVVFLSDMQAESWRSGEKSAEELGRIMSRLEARKPRVVVVDLGTAGEENRAVVGLEIDAPVVAAGMTAHIRALVRSYSSRPETGVRVRLEDDGRQGPEETVDLPPGEAVPVIFRRQFTTPGDHLLEVALDDDPLLVDNRRRLVVPVRESLSVLLVDGSYKSEAYQAETDYLAQALAPSDDEAGKGRMIKVEVISESRLGSRELAPYDVIVLCNVGQFAPQEVAALEQFLRQGGGLVFFGGDQVSAENYNRVLHDDGRGILPVALGPTVGDAARKEAGFLINPLGFRHPIVADYEGEADTVTSGLTQALTWRYHKLVLPKNSQAKVALAFDDGDPAVVESKGKRGTVIVVATSADAGWTTWPLHKSYPPVMQQVVLQAASGKLEERNIDVGAAYDQSFPAAAVAAPVTITTPSGRSITGRLGDARGLGLLHFEQTDLAGRYEAKVGPPLSVSTLFAANPDPAESDLTKIDRSGVQSLFAPLSVVYVAGSGEVAVDPGSVGRKGELHRPLLQAILILLLVESVLAWLFGRSRASTRGLLRS